MKKRIISLMTTVSFLISAVPMVSSAADIEPVGFDFKDATVYNAASIKDEFISENISGRRLALSSDAASGKWIISKFDDTAENIDAKKEAPMDQADYDAFKSSSQGWDKIDVPTKLMANPEYEKAHRVWYKTTIDIPSSEVNKGFYLDFDGTNYAATLVVNDHIITTNTLPRMQWEADITGKLKAGKNEILIGLKSPRYAIDVEGIQSRTDSDVLKGMKKLSDYFEFDWYGKGAFNVDVENRDILYNDLIYPTSKGESSGDEFGITDNLYLVSTEGQTYVEDIFVKTTVADKTTWKPTNKKITAEITVKNPTGTAKTVKIASKAVLRDKNNVINLPDTEITFASNEFVKTATVSADAPDAVLWWPDLTEQPMYDFIATVTEGGKEVDLYKQSFGFRDVNIDGIHFRINGEKRKFWHTLGGLEGKNEEEAIKHFKKGNNRMERMSATLGLENVMTDTKKKLGRDPKYSEQIDWLDKSGIPVRLSSMVGGMFASYAIMINGKPNITMWENFKEYLEAYTIAHRNHPSVLLYSIEDELIFINAALIYGSYCDKIEQDAKKYLYDPVVALDNTKPSSYDGGGNGLDNSMPVYNSHYQEDTDITTNDKPTTELTPMHGRWEYDGKVPYVGGELAFYSGENQSHSWLGGDDTANGRNQALEAYTKYIKWTFNRHRFNDSALTCVWTAQESTKAAHPSLNEIAVIPRDYSTNFYASKGKTVEARMFNDTFSYHEAPKPINLTWKLVIDGKAVKEGSMSETIAAGESKKVDIIIPSIENITERKDAVLQLRAKKDGAKDFEENIEMSVFPDVSNVSIGKKVYAYKINAETKAALKELGVKYTNTPSKVKAKKTVYQAKKNKKAKWKTVSKKLYKKTKKKLRRTKKINSKKITYQTKKSKKAKWKTVSKKVYKKAKKKLRRIKKTQIYKAWNLSAANYKQVLKTSNSILLIGSKSIKSDSATEGEFVAIARFARAGGRVIVLEQNENNMLTSDEPTDPNQLPEKITTPGSTAQGQYNFSQAFDTPILEGLKLKDLSFWTGAKRTTSPLWTKPGGSVKSWVYAGSPNETSKGLSFTSLMEVPAEKGMVLATQLNVGQTVSVEPAAKVILRNMLKRADSYELAKGVLAVLDNSPDELKNVIKRTNVQYKEFASADISTPLNSSENYPMIIVEATETNLDMLNSQKALCEEYASKGGWIMLWGLVPDADKVDKWGYPVDGKDINDSKTLSKFNTLLGTKHVMRPFRVESTKAGGIYYDKIALGLSTQDVFLGNKVVIAPWISLTDVSKQTFSYAVDATDNIAPFHPFELEAVPAGVKQPQFKAVYDPISKKRDISQIPDSIGRDQNNGNMVDDLYSEDFWFYQRQIWVGSDYDSAKTYIQNNPIADWKFPSEDEIDNVVIHNNDSYGWYTRIKIDASLNNSNVKTVENDVSKNEDTIFNFENTKANQITIRGLDLDVGKMVGTSNVMTGIDEIKVNRKTPQWAIDAGVKSLTSNGTIVKYARGDKINGGGYLLNNIKLSKYYDYLDNPDKQITDGKQDEGLKASMEPSTNEQSKVKVFSIFFKNIGCKFDDKTK